MTAGLLSVLHIPMPASTASNHPTRLCISLLSSRSSIPLTRRPIPRPSLRSSALVFSLPTAKPEMAAAEKIPKWSLSAIKSFALAEVEARRLKYPTAGTEALLMGILVEGTNDAARFLHANGITLFKVREETVKLLGKSDLFFVSPEEIPFTESAQRALDKAIDEKLKS
ncbi:ATP-dependent Clp protease ATP-binding subunit CLPT1, chloroplastic-like, partial [Curcuma longa]